MCDQVHSKFNKIIHEEDYRDAPWYYYEETNVINILFLE